MSEINKEQENNSETILNYIKLLNSLFITLQKNPLQSLEELSNDYLLYSLLKEIDPNFENILSINKLIFNSDDINIKSNNFMLILSAIDNYSDKFKKKFFSIEKIINKELNELIKLAEMIITLSILCNNKNIFIEKMNKIEDNKINKLYYSTIEKYIDFKIGKNDDNNNIRVKPIQINGDDLIDFIYNEEDNNNNNNQIQNINEKNKINDLTNEIIELKERLKKYEQESKNDNNIIIKKEDYIIEKGENIIILEAQEKENNILIENLKNENEDLHRTIDNLSIEKQELCTIIDKLNITIKELESDYQKLKEEYDIKEISSSEIITNNKSMIEKLNHDLKLEIKLNKKFNEEKEFLEKELNKYKEELNKHKIKDINEDIINLKEEQIKKLKEKNKESEKEKEMIKEKNIYYKKSYEEQKIRVNEEHKLISESLYKLAIHFMTLKDDLQNRINSAKKNNN